MTCTDEQVSLMYRDVVRAEIANWVPEASQRLIQRVSRIVGAPVVPDATEADHGSNPGDHALMSDWVAGIYVLRCSTCQRLFKA